MEHCHHYLNVCLLQQRYRSTLFKFQGISNVTAFIGGTKENESWIWIDGSPFSYINWASGEPSGDELENCLELNSKYGTWSDVHCNNSQNENSAICSVDSGK